MARPPYGLHLPVKAVRCRDGDTVEVSLPGSSYVWAIRLMDCWTPEINHPGGRDAMKAASDQLRAHARTLSVYIPEPKNIRNLLKNLTFDRIPAYIYLDDETSLNEWLVRNGYARRTKRG